MILVFGKSGQVGRALSTRAGVTCFGRDMADLSNPAQCADLIRQKKPQAVINAAAYTNVDTAESEPDLAHVINAQAPAAMAKACQALKIPFVQISTDYVFEGTSTAPHNPQDPTAPRNVYGVTKRGGEEATRAANPTHAILRTSWVFSEHGSNFVKSMLRLGAERDTLNIVADQIGGPTAADDIADACLDIAQALLRNPNISGTYHFSGAPSVSWADFAREIFRQAQITCAVENIPSSAYPTPAERPKNSRMNCESLSVFPVAQPDWRVSLTKVLKKLEQLS